MAGHLPSGNQNDSRAISVRERGSRIWIADAHRDDGQRFIVHADEKLSAFLELERTTSDENHRNQTIRNGWQVYEAPGVQPVFLNPKEQAI